MIISKRINLINLCRIFFLLFLFSIFFPIRYVFPTSESYITGLYSDFTTFSLYLSDIFLFIAFFFILWYNYKYFIEFIVNCKLLVALWIWLILAIFIFNPHISGLNFWSFFKFFELIVVAYGTIKAIFNYQFSISKSWFLGMFILLGTVQSIIGLMQFLKQAPIGLSKLGEQQIYPYLSGVAKIVSGGTIYIRAYGTFPHPNILSVFLLVAIFLLIHLSLNQQKPNLTSNLFSKHYSLITKIILNLALFINILGLTVTFSRGAFLALGLGLLVFFGLLAYWLKKPVILNSFQNLDSRSVRPLADSMTKNLKVVAINILLALAVAFLIFKPFLLSRATISDQATIERKIYNQTARNMIKANPVIGKGAGESLLHMEQYSPVKLKPWQIQPIHNYFLLSASEIGIFGSLILILVFLSHLFGIWNLKIWDLFKNWKLEIRNLKTSFYRLTLFTILICFIILMLFDHYFYTIQSTQMLLWMTLGIIASTKENEINQNP